ncbi:MAG: murein biosynthesis integral membrane protein MurJ [Thermoanaerobacterales bacterium]|nr:murein biosynthesis integral membrane protein MurJ [Thermoanaerobacterales bacterium]
MSRRRRRDERGAAPERQGGEPRARRVRRSVDEAELHYGEENRRRAREFFGRSPGAATGAEGGGAAPPGGDRPGPRRLRWAGAEPPAYRWSPEEVTGELPLPADMFGLAPESPGLAQQPPGPWMTGEHRAVHVEEPWATERDDPGGGEPGAAGARPPADRPDPWAGGSPARGADPWGPGRAEPHAPREAGPWAPDPEATRAPDGRAGPWAPGRDETWSPGEPTGGDAGWARQPAADHEPGWAPAPSWDTPDVGWGGPDTAEQDVVWEETWPATPGPTTAAEEAAGDAGGTTTAAPEEAEPAPRSNARGSLLVAAGIFLSRCAGLIREMVTAAFLGAGPAADAFKAALRIPNLMQNLLGEGVLSASFIPVYARLRAEGRDEEAGHVAGAIAGLLAALTGVISLVGVVFAAPLTDLLVPGFAEDKYELTVQLTRIMFPGIGFLVLSAWCLGVLNSHKQFFLSYVAPVLWNVAQIAALVGGAVVVGGHTSAADQRDLAVALSWGVFVGGVLQFGVQLRPVRRLLGAVRPNLHARDPWVRSVIGRFLPVLAGRGAIQIMGWVDLWLASYLVSGAVSSLTYTMVLYLLPVSLFGVSVAAAELPDMSQVSVHDPDTRRRFRLRLEDSMARMGWYVAFTATMFIVVGDVIVAAVFERGSFGRADTVAVWLTLAVLAVGLLPATATRLLQNGLYALDDPRTPARLGVLGVVLSAIVGLAFMFPLDRLYVGPEQVEGWGDVFAVGPLPAAVRDDPEGVVHLGILGLAIGATVSRWVEYRMLSTALAWRIGRTKLAGRWLPPISVGCAVAAVVAAGAERVLAALPDVVEVVLVVGPAGLAYMAVTHRLGVPEARATVARLGGIARRLRR